MIKRLLACVAIVGGVAFAVPAPVQALTAPQPLTHFGACSGGVASFLGLKSWDACLTKNANGSPQITKLSDVWLIALPLLEDAIKLAGYTAAGFVIWGGVKYIKSQGDPGQINEARLVIYHALFGLLLAMISVALVNFIAGAFGNTTTPNLGLPKVDLNAATVGAALTAVFTLIGGLATLFLLIGAVRYVTSNGDPGQMNQAKNTILYAAVGIVVSLSAFAIVQFVVGQLST